MKANGMNASMKKNNSLKSIKHQRGMGMLQWALVLAIAGFFLLFAFKVIPLYAENRYVESALRSLENGGEKLDQMTDAEITKKLNNFYMINNVRSEGPTKNIKIEREWIMKPAFRFFITSIWY